jgi:hypothetical protein
MHRPQRPLKSVTPAFLKPIQPTTHSCSQRCVASGCQLEPTQKSDAFRPQRHRIASKLPSPRLATLAAAMLAGRLPHTQAGRARQPMAACGVPVDWALIQTIVATLKSRQWAVQYSSRCSKSMKFPHVSTRFHCTAAPPAASACVDLLHSRSAQRAGPKMQLMETYKTHEFCSSVYTMQAMIHISRGCCDASCNVICYGYTRWLLIWRQLIRDLLRQAGNQLGINQQELCS